VRQKLANLEAIRNGANITAGDLNLSAKVQEQLLQTERELKALAGSEDGLTNELDKLQTAISKLDAIETAYSDLQQQAQVAHDNYRLYRTRAEESRINDTMDAEKIAGIRVLEEAMAPNAPRKSKRKAVAIAGSAVGVLVGFFIGLLLELFGGCIEFGRDIEEGLGLPLLAEIAEARTE
jgi:uncharacterized protein involved in exopolysaccharide biosynthesis